MCLHIHFTELTMQTVYILKHYWVHYFIKKQVNSLHSRDPKLYYHPQTYNSLNSFLPMDIGAQWIMWLTIFNSGLIDNPNRKSPPLHNNMCFYLYLKKNNTCALYIDAEYRLWQRMYNGRRAEWSIDGQWEVRYEANGSRTYERKTKD